MELACDFCSAPTAARRFPGALLLAFWARGRRFLRTSLAKGGVFQKATRSELWERWRCVCSPAPQPRRDCSSPGSPRARPAPWPVRPAVRAAAPHEEGVSSRRLLSPRSSEDSILKTCLCLPAPRASTPGHLAPSLRSQSFPTEIRKSVRVAATAGRALRESDAFRGNLRAGPAGFPLFAYESGGWWGEGVAPASHSGYIQLKWAFWERDCRRSGERGDTGWLSGWAG